MNPKWESLRHTGSDRTMSHTLMGDQRRGGRGTFRGRQRWRMRPTLLELEARMLLSTIVVNNPTDTPVAGKTDLRQAIVRANTNGGAETITFDKTVFNTPKTINLDPILGQLELNDPTGTETIDGPGASELAISGNAASRLFEIGSGAKVVISGLTLTDGLATDGAAVLNAGNLTLTQDVLSADVAQGVAGGGLFGYGAGMGGGVENEAGATLTVSQSNFTGDLALGDTGGGNAFGGAIDNEAGTVTIDHSTFTGDQAVAANGGAVSVAVTLPGGLSASLLGVAGGGGVWNDGGAFSVTNSTLTDNLAQGGSNGNAEGSTAAFVVVGTAMGGAIGQGAFFTAATPSLVVGKSTFTGNQSLGGSNLFYAVSNYYPPYPADAGSGRGGALGSVAGSVSVSQSTITGNTAQGGSLATDVLDGITLIIMGSSGFGGAVDDEFDFGFTPPPAATALTIVGTSIKSNAALGSGPSGSGNGGGVASAEVNASVSNSIVEDNHATGSFGGGFSGSTSGFYSYTYGGGTASGGGLYSSSGALTISASAVDDNLAQGGPGGANFNGGGAGGGGVQLLCAAGPIQRDPVRESGDRRHVKWRDRWRFRRRRARLRFGDDHQHRFHG